MTGHSDADLFNTNSTIVNLKNCSTLILNYFEQEDVINLHVSWHAKITIEQSWTRWCIKNLNHLNHAYKQVISKFLILMRNFQYFRFRKTINFPLVHYLKIINIFIVLLSVILKVYFYFNCNIPETTTNMILLSARYIGIKVPSRLASFLSVSLFFSLLLRNDAWI